MLVFSLVLRPHTQSVPSPTLIYLHMQNHAVTNLVCCILMQNHAVTNLAPMLHPHAQSCSHQLSSHVAFTCTKAPIAQPNSPQPPELIAQPDSPQPPMLSLHNQTVPSLPCSHCTTRQSPASQAHCTTRQSPASHALIAQPDSPQPPMLSLHNQTVPSLPSSLHNQTVPSLPSYHCTTRQSPASQAPLHNQTVPSLPSSHCTTRQSPASQATIVQPDSPQPPNPQPDSSKPPNAQFPVSQSTTGQFPTSHVMSYICMHNQEAMRLQFKLQLYSAVSIQSDFLRILDFFSLSSLAIQGHHSSSGLSPMWETCMSFNAKSHTCNAQ